MKRFTGVLVILIMLLSMFPLNIFAMENMIEGAEQSVKLTIGGKSYTVGNRLAQTDVAPYIKSLSAGGGRTMVPVAFVAPALGTEPAVWLPDERAVLVNKGDKQIRITIDSKELLVNGKKLQMDVAAEIKDLGNGGGRTMLPIAFIARALEVGYEWNEADRSVKFFGYNKTFEAQGTYGPDIGSETIEGNVIIKADGITLQNTIIKGNLTISEEVGDGDVTLNNITVQGNTYIRGGGEDSIHINGGRYANVVIDNVEGRVRVVATDVNNLQVVISDDAAGEEIILEGGFENVLVQAAGTKITLSSDTVVEKMVLDSRAEVKGTGTIKEADVNADGVTFEKDPHSQTVNPLVVTPPTNTTGTGSVVTGGGGGGSSSDDSSPPVSAVGAVAITTAPAVVSGLAYDAGTVTVTLSSATSGAEIRYTTNGSTPTASSTLYTAPFTVSNTNGAAGGTYTVKAIGIKSGMTNSAVAQKAIVYNPQTTATVNTAAEFAVAIANNNVTSITLGGDFTGDVTAIRTGTNNLNINFSSFVLTGNMNVTANSVTNLTLSGTAVPAITGNLTVSATSATVTNGLSVGGTITVNDVGSHSWIEQVDGNRIILTDSNGGSVVIEGNPDEITVESTADGGINITTNTPAKITINAGANVANITASSTAAGTSIVNNGTVASVTANSDIDLENNNGAVNIGGGGTVGASGTAANDLTVTDTAIVVEGISALLGVDQAEIRMGATTAANITGIVPGPGETLNVASANTSIVTVDDAAGLAITAQAPGKTAVTVQVKNADSDVIKQGTVFITVLPELISAASAAIDVPTAGATPQTAAQIEAATGNGDYTVAGVTWNEALTEAGKFKAGQVYTANIVLVSKNNKAFQSAAFTPTVTGAASVGTTVTVGSGVGNRVSFTVAFPSTASLAISSIAVTTQPTKISYTEYLDDTLVLNGMVVTETNNDGTTAVVAFADGTATGYTANPANGTVLVAAVHDGTAVTITHNASAKTATTGTLTVAAFDPVDITSASVTITAPVAGATPETALGVEVATANADYTVSGLTWNEAFTAGGKFKAGQVYTATVELTSKNTKEFQAAAFTPTVAGAASVGTTTTTGTGVGNTVSFTVNYAATSALEVNNITVKTQPATLNYVEGQSLSLAGLVATLTYNDGTTEDVASADFAAKGITANPSNGTALTAATHNGNPVTLSCNGKTATTANLVVIAAVNDTATVNEDGTVLLDVLTNDVAGTAAVSITGFTQGVNGTVSQEGNSLRYTPDANYSGTDSFTYDMSDGISGTDTATVNVTVNPVNDVPTANDDTATVAEDGTVLIDVLVNDTDVDGDTLTVSGYTQGINGTVAQEGDSLRYTPDANFNGVDNFGYTINDGNGGTAGATIYVTVNPVNDAPTANDNMATVEKDGTVLIDVLVNDTDVDGDTIAISGFTQGVNGTVSQEGDSLRYTPDAGYIGGDSFTYEISDGNGGTDTATVNMNVVDQTAPALSATGISGVTDTTATLEFTSNEAGTYYYLIYTAEDAAPDAATIKAQGTAVAKGTSAAAAAANAVDVTGLTALTSYNAYVVVEDGSANISAVATIPFMTTADPSTFLAGDLLAADAGTNFIGVLYSKDGNIYYNTTDASGLWGTETLLGSGTEGNLDIKADKPQVVYTTSGAIGYRAYDGTTWTAEQLISSRNGGSCSKADIAVDSSGYAHITYTDTMGDTGIYNRDDIMYAVNSSGSFVKHMVYNGYYENLGGADYIGDYYNKGSYIAVDGNDNYYVATHRQQYTKNMSWNASTYSVSVKMNPVEGSQDAIGNTATSSSNIFDIYDLTAGGGKLEILYKHTTFKKADLTSSAGTISFGNISELAAGTVSSVATDGSDVVVGGKASTATNILQTHYNGSANAYDGMVVKGLKVSVVKLGDKFYALYTDNGDGNIKGTEVAGDLSGFNVALVEAGDKYQGVMFGLGITGAKDAAGDNLAGDVNVTVTSDRADAEVYNGAVTFTAGEANLPVVLHTVASHTLTVAVTGVTEPQQLSVNVAASQASITPSSAAFTNTDASATITVTAMTDAAGNDVLAAFTADGGAEAIYTYMMNDNATTLIDVTVTKATGSADLVIANPAQATAAGDYALMICRPDGNQWDIPVTVTAGDLSGFNVALVEAGDKYAGDMFGLSITGAKDTAGDDLAGDVNVTVTSDQADGEVYNGTATFTAGAANLPVCLNTVASHTLTVAVTGVTDTQQLSVNVLTNQRSITTNPTTVTFDNTDASATITVTAMTDAAGNDVLAAFTADDGTAYSCMMNDNATTLINVTVTKTAGNADLVIANPAQATSAGAYTLMIGETDGTDQWDVSVTVTEGTAEPTYSPVVSFGSIDIQVTNLTDENGDPITFADFYAMLDKDTSGLRFYKEGGGVTDIFYSFNQLEANVNGDLSFDTTTGDISILGDIELNTVAFAEGGSFQDFEVFEHDRASIRAKKADASWDVTKDVAVPYLTLAPAVNGSDTEITVTANEAYGAGDLAFLSAFDITGTYSSVDLLGATGLSYAAAKGNAVAVGDFGANTIKAWYVFVDGFTEGAENITGISSTLTAGSDMLTISAARTEGQTVNSAITLYIMDDSIGTIRYLQLRLSGSGAGTTVAVSPVSGSGTATTLTSVGSNYTVTSHATELGKTYNTIAADETPITIETLVGAFLNNINKSSEYQVCKVTTADNVPASASVFGPAPAKDLATDTLAVGDVLTVLSADWTTIRSYAITVTSSTPAAKEMAWSGTVFEEAAGNDGSIATVVTLALTNETFVVTDGIMTAATHYNVANVPSGLTAVVTGVSSTTATVVLTGNAVSHAAADSIANLGLVFLDAAFTGGVAADVTNYGNPNLSVTFDDPVITGISGTVTSTVDGSPIAGVDVRFSPAQSDTTDESGQYSITNVENGTSYIQLYADFYYHGQTPHQVSIPGTYDAVMQPAGMITGTINLEGSLPEGSYIEAQISETNNIDTSIVTGTTFSVRGVPIGTKTLSFVLKNAAEQYYVYISSDAGDHDLASGVTLNSDVSYNSTLSVPVTHPDGVSDDGIIDIGTVKIINGSLW